METVRAPFRRYLFVCENRRDDGASCAARGSERLRELLKERVKDRGLAPRVRVSRSGCLDTCAAGPNVILMPDGVWFRGIAENDLDAIVGRAAEGLEGR